MSSEQKSFDFVAFARLFNQRARIVVYGAYETHMAGMVETQITQACEVALTLGQTYVTIVIDSRGELAPPIKRLLALMEVYRPTPEFRFVGYVMGFAYGRALQLLQYCDWRVAHASALLQLNYASQTLNNLDQALLYENDPEFLAFERNRTSEEIDAICRRSGLSATRVHELCAKAQPMTARQALALGLIDEVIDNLPTQSTRPDYSVRWANLPPAPAPTPQPDASATADADSDEVAAAPATPQPPAPLTPHSPDIVTYRD